MGEVSDKKIFLFSVATGSAAASEVALLAPSVAKDSAMRSSHSGTGVLFTEGTR